MPHSTKRRTLTTTETSLMIIENLKRMNGARVTELADELEMAPSTVHSHLATLENAHYLVKRGDIYHIGLKFLDLGEYIRYHDHRYAIVEEKVEQLAAETTGRAYFVVEEHGRGVYVYTRSEKRPIKTYSRDGKRFYLHQAAAGKAILANLPKKRVEDIVEQWGLPEQTENTITNPEQLFAELERIRDHEGIAYNDEEQIQGLRAVGAPACAPSGDVIGAFSVSGPAHQLKGNRFDTVIPEALKGIANEFELDIHY